MITKDGARMLRRLVVFMPNTGRLAAVFPKERVTKMNAFKKIGDEWGVSVETGGATGETITVETRAGKRKQVVLGEFVSDGDFGRVFKIAQMPRASAATLLNNQLTSLVEQYGACRVTEVLAEITTLKTESLS